MTATVVFLVVLALLTFGLWALRLWLVGDGYGRSGGPEVGTDWGTPGSPSQRYASARRVR